jgi:hypothetical protein
VLLVDCGCEMAMLFHELSMRAPETAAAIQSRARGVSQSRRSSQALLELGFDVSMASHYRLNSACSALANSHARSGSELEAAAGFMTSSASSARQLRFKALASCHTRITVGARYL